MEELLAEEARRTRDDSAESAGKKRVREESDEVELDSPEVKRLREDLLGELDDSDPDPESQDLDSVMKSFEDELSATKTAQGSGETQVELGYLLEASDDELGLPPPPEQAPPFNASTETATELVRVSSDSSGMGEFWEFEDQMASYESFELGGFVEFEYSDDCFEAGALGTLPAELKEET